MSRKCVLYKTCSVCQKEKHNLEFYSNKKGREGIKPFCKSCKTIYFGIKQNLIEAKTYIGKNFDTAILVGDEENIITHINHKGELEKITLEFAINLIKQGGACIVSPNTVESLIQWSPYRTKINRLLKKIVRTRDKKTCHYCGDYAETIDHVIPRVKGGINTVLNLVCSCEACNALKDSMSKETFIRKRRTGVISNRKLNRLKRKINKRKENGEKIEKKQEPIITTKKSVEKRVKTSGERCCKICSTYKSIQKFAPYNEICRKCQKLKIPFERGWITSEKIASISTDSKELKGHTTIIHYSNGTKEVIPKSLAKEYTKAGFVEVINKGTIRVLFTEDKIKKLFKTLFKEPKVV